MWRWTSFCAASSYRQQQRKDPWSWRWKWVLVYLKGNCWRFQVFQKQTLTYRVCRCVVSEKEAVEVFLLLLLLFFFCWGGFVQYTHVHARAFPPTSTHMNNHLLPFTSPPSTSTDTRAHTCTPARTDTHTHTRTDTLENESITTRCLKGGVLDQLSMFALSFQLILQLYGL